MKKKTQIEELNKKFEAIYLPRCKGINSETQRVKGIS